MNNWEERFDKLIRAILDELYHGFTCQECGLGQGDIDGKIKDFIAKEIKEAEERVLKESLPDLICEFAVDGIENKPISEFYPWLKENYPELTNTTNKPHHLGCDIQRGNECTCDEAYKDDEANKDTECPNNNNKGIKDDNVPNKESINNLRR